MAFGKYFIIVVYFYVYISYILGEDIDSLAALLETKQDDGIIKGNPLLLPECANAIIEQHGHNLNYLQKIAMPNPWFWSRESLSAVTKNMPLKRHSKFTHSNWASQSIDQDTLTTYEYLLNRTLIKRGILDWYHEIENEDDEEDDEDKTCYYHIEKSGSSSISVMMYNFGFNTSYMSENSEVHCGCGFTLVRDPISRFVSGYYTIQQLIYQVYSLTKVKEKFSFWNVTGEPQRMRKFIEDMHHHSFEFVDSSPLEHLMTQVGVLSVSKFDIHFIGDVKNIMEHLEIIKNKCAMQTDNEELLNQELIEKREMAGYGTTRAWKVGKRYEEMLSLDHHLKSDLKPAYLAIADNYDLYQKIVEYYKQDYICFGFEHDWEKFRNKIYEKFKKTTEERKRRKWGETMKGIIEGIQISLFGGGNKEKDEEIRSQAESSRPTKKVIRPRRVKRNELAREYSVDSHL